jgi:hypothetical protein
MMRLISLILFLGGIAAAALGAMVLMERSGMPRIGSAPIEASAELDEWPVEAAEIESDGVIAMEDFPEEPASMESPGAAMSEMPMGAAALPPPPPPAASMSAPSAAMDEFATGAAPAPSSAPMPMAAPPARPRRATRTLSPPSETMDDTETSTSETRSLSVESPAATIATAPVVPAAPQKSAGELFMESLKTVPIAHETPKSAGYKQNFDVVLAIDATGDDDATDALPGRGNIVAGEAQVSDRVEARLSGAAFDIQSTSPGVQTLSPVTENTWRWSVSALSPGEHDLVFEIFAIDQDAATPLRTYRDTVTVEVTGISRAIAFADQANPVFVLLGGLGSALAGLFGVIQFFRRKRA